MDAADEPANTGNAEDQAGEPNRNAKPNANPGLPDKAQHAKALDDLMAELFFELDGAENEAPRSWLQLERRRAKRSS